MDTIRAWRIKAGLTQGELAERLGLSLNTILNYEKGRREPRVSELKRLADLFGCSLDELVNPPRSSGSGISHQVAEATSK